MEQKITELCKCEQHVSLKDKTWIHRGGMVDYWLQPATIEELTVVGKYLYNHQENFLVIGHTSNIYFKNSYNVRCIVDTRKLTAYRQTDKGTLCCDCGAPMARISRWCVDNGISGYEGMVNLPGTVGGGYFW